MGPTATAALGSSARMEGVWAFARDSRGAEAVVSGIEGAARVGMDAQEEPMKKKATPTRAVAGPRWEYRIVRPIRTFGPDGEQVGPSLEAHLSELGAAGWELITQLDDRQLLFKRPKR
jgi:hypothetical protein